MVGRITRALRTKAGLAFERGDLVLLDPARIETVNGKAYRYAYSSRTRMNTAIPVTHVVDAAARA